GSNTVHDFLWFAGILLAGLLIRLLFSKGLARIVYALVKKHAHGVPFEKLFELVRRPLGNFILLVAVYFAFDQLSFPAEWKLAPPEKFGVRMIAERVLFVAIAISFTWIILRIVDFFGLIMMHRASLTESKADDQLVPFFKESIKVIVFILSVFFILGAIFQMNVASLVAGLGIGGLAVALAAKESLENLIGSFTIFLDKPFVVGDLVQVGPITGTVERIGFRSTRIRTLEKSIVTVPNKKMVEAELDNLTKRTHRRVRFAFRISYNTPPESVRKIVTELQAFFEYHPHIDTHESRVRFYDLGESAINIMVEYYVIGNEADMLLDIREEVNFKIMEIVHKNGSAFAYPATSVFVHQGPGA
ncbi:MAG: mechanosensitive ion channel family protein, partial [Bacteroidota bacterium]